MNALRQKEHGIRARFTSSLVAELLPPHRSYHCVMKHATWTSEYLRSKQEDNERRKYCCAFGHPTFVLT